MDEQTRKKLAGIVDYMSTFLGNVAVIGAGLALFDGWASIAGLALIVLLLGAYLKWRVL